MRDEMVVDTQGDIQRLDSPSLRNPSDQETAKLGRSSLTHAAARTRQVEKAASWLFFSILRTTS